MRSKNDGMKRSIYSFVNDWRSEYGGSPSLGDIAARMGVSRTTVYRYLREMTAEGMLAYSGDGIFTKEMNPDTMLCSRAAVVGSIPCGESVAEEEYIEEYVNLPANLFGKGEFYILRAKGDSMEDAGIREGDLVVIRRQLTAEAGDIVVALDDDSQNTLKRFGGYDEDGKAVLEYMNRAVYGRKVIRVENLTVQGVAKHVIRAL